MSRTAYLRATTMFMERLRNNEVARTMRPKLSRIAFLQDWARRNEVSVPMEFVRAYIKQWQQTLRTHGLTPDDYTALLAERALSDWLTKEGPASFGLRDSFIVAWAAQNNVTLPLEFLGQGATDETLENWIIEQGPEYFGLNWSFDKALREELQVSGCATQRSDEREEATAA